MARTEGRLKTSIWSDPDFLALEAEPQRLYLFLLSQSDLSHAGLLPLRARRWAAKVSGATAATISAALAVLTCARFVVVDDDTEELLIRTFVRNDGVYKQPKVMLRMREDARQIESPLLRAAFLTELDRLPIHELNDAPGGPRGDQPSTQQTVMAVVDALRGDFAMPSEGVSGRVSGTPPEGDAIPPRVHAGAFPHPPSPVPLPPAPTPSTSEAAPSDTPRIDVEALCDLLADLIEANDVKRPTVTRRWRDAARLLLDKDGYTAEQVEWMARWATSHEFWRANILSMPTLRERFDQLKLQATAGRSAPGRLTTDDKARIGLDLAAAIRAEDAAKSAAVAQIGA